MSKTTDYVLEMMENDMFYLIRPFAPMEDEPTEETNEIIQILSEPQEV